MRNFRLFSAWMVLTAVFLAGPALGQRNYNRIKGNGKVIKTSQILPSFSKIKAGGANQIIIIPNGNKPFTLVIETDENLVNEIQASVTNNTLSFKYRNLNPTRLKFYVSVPSLTGIIATGAADVRSADTLKGDQLKLNVSGAADIKLLLHFKHIQLISSGAADVLLGGKCRRMDIDASGATDVKVGKLAADSVFAKAGGASNIHVNPLKYLSKNVSGVADINITHKPQRIIDIRSSHFNPRIIVSGSRISNMGNNDTTHINVGSINLEVVNGDTTKVSLGGHTLIVDENGNVNWKRNKKIKFNGHWGGVELGINGFANANANTDFGREYDFLNLDYEKSFNLNLNLYEQNIAFNKAKTIGLVTGFGFGFNDYRFSNPTYLSPESNSLSGFYMRNVSVNKSKLSLIYVDVPLIVEFQTNNPRRGRRFHFGVGVIVNARIRTHSKIYFNEADKVYSLEDPATGDLLSDVYRSPNRGERNIVKSISAFNIRPFRFDGTFRIGYGLISLFANVALNPMFQKNRGPQLYQWSMGLTLAGW